MENPVENEIVQRWEAEQRTQDEMEATIAGRPKKRPRKAIENGVGRSTGVPARLQLPGSLDEQGEGFIVEEVTENESTAGASETASLVRGTKGRRR
jgi:hypothetical protein